MAFLIEATGERLGCLLNPNSVEVRRLAGIKRRRSAAGPVTRAGLADDPLLYTGGGSTELKLDLLFDVSLAGSSITTDNVRELTAPLWNLAENSGENGENIQPPLVRFVWGKVWNFPGLVTAVSERLEFFTPQGAPRRSWLRMRLLRVSEPGQGDLDSKTPPPLEDLPTETQLPEAVPAEENIRVHEVIGGGTESEDLSGEDGRVMSQRLDEIALEHYGDPAYWRLIARFNAIVNPIWIPPGMLLQLPPRSVWGGGS